MKKEINKDNINDVISLSKKILKLIYIVMIIGIIFLSILIIKESGILNFFITLFKVLIPFFIGFIIAWIFNPIVNKLVVKGIKRSIASIIVYLVFISFLFLFFYFLIPTLYNQLNDLIDSFPKIISQLQELINNINIKHIDSIKEFLFNSINNIVNMVSTNLPSLIINSVSNIFNVIGIILLSLVIGLYILINFANINKFIHELILTKHEKSINRLLDEIKLTLRRCVNSTLLVAFIVFILDSIGFLIIGLKAPILFGLLCGITDLIPYIGPYIGGIGAVIVGFSQSTIIGIITLIIVVIVQIIENFLLQPIVMSKTIKLNPLTIMLGLLIFGHFFGILGMVLATPIIALLKVIICFIANKYKLLNY